MPIKTHCDSNSKGNNSNEAKKISLYKKWMHQSRKQSIT